VTEVERGGENGGRWIKRGGGAYGGIEKAWYGEETIHGGKEGFDGSYGVVRKANLTNIIRGFIYF
jgi:hypothetical protein